MKAIEISLSNENQFLQAAQIARLKVSKKTEVAMPGRIVYEVIAPFSQNDIFKLGVYYAQLTLSSNEED